MKRGGGTEPKYIKDNYRVQYLHLTQDNQTQDIWDVSYKKYLVDLEIIETQFEWDNPVGFDDLRVAVSFPSRLRPLQIYQPETRNTVIIFNKLQFS